MVRSVLAGSFSVDRFPTIDLSPGTHPGWLIINPNITYEKWITVRMVSYFVELPQSIFPKYTNSPTFPELWVFPRHQPISLILSGFQKFQKSGNPGVTLTHPEKLVFPPKANDKWMPLWTTWDEKGRVFLPRREHRAQYGKSRSEHIFATFDGDDVVNANVDKMTHGERTHLASVWYWNN